MRGKETGEAVEIGDACDTERKAQDREAPSCAKRMAAVNPRASTASTRYGKAQQANIKAFFVKRA